MKTYIINLEQSTDRKEYMREQMKKLPQLDYEFIPAVDGRKMSEDERNKYFDCDRFLKHYSIKVRPGEIGCTLSHQKCYRKIVENKEPYVLILEDDIALTKDINSILSQVEKLILQDIPQVILLSGWYWYLKGIPIMDKYNLMDVYNAYLTHSYIINQAAAKLLIEDRPFITADDWFYIRKKGVKLQAIKPHLINQNWDGSLPTTVNVEQKRRKSLMWRISNLSYLLNLKLLSLSSHFEKG